MNGRPMTEQECKVAEILRRRLAFVDDYTYEGPEIKYDSVAVEIVRTLVADAAFAVLTGVAQPTANLSDDPFWCSCRVPVPLSTARGTRRCQTCRKNTT